MDHRGTTVDLRRVGGCCFNNHAWLHTFHAVIRATGCRMLIVALSAKVAQCPERDGNCAAIAHDAMNISTFPKIRHRHCVPFWAQRSCLCMTL